MEKLFMNVTFVNVFTSDSELLDEIMEVESEERKDYIKSKLLPFVRVDKLENLFCWPHDCEVEGIEVIEMNEDILSFDVDCKIGLTYKDSLEKALKQIRLYEEENGDLRLESRVVWKYNSGGAKTTKLILFDGWDDEIFQEQLDEGGWY